MVQTVDCSGGVDAVWGRCNWWYCDEMMRRKWLYGWAVNEGVVEHEKGEEDRVESSEEGHGGSMWGLEESRRGRGKESLRRSHDIGGGRRVSSEEGLVKIPEVEAVEELSEVGCIARDRWDCSLFGVELFHASCFSV